MKVTKSVAPASSKFRPAPKAAKTTTTNYPPDTHDKFCSRCFTYNRGCPRNKYRLPLKSCKD